MTSLYSIDRQSAARILSVSVRTVDRYIASGQIRKVKNQGRTWLSNDDIQGMVAANRQTDSDTVLSSFASATKREVESSSGVSDHDNVSMNGFSGRNSGAEASSLNYKNLYEEVKVSLEDKNQKLQQATYRIGQLESQVKSMVPRLQFEQQQKLLIQKAENMEGLFKSEVEKREVVTKKLISQLKLKEGELESEKFNKAIYAILLFLIIFTLIFVIFLNYIG